MELGDVKMFTNIEILPCEKRLVMVEEVKCIFQVLEAVIVMGRVLSSTSSKGMPMSRRQGNAKAIKLQLEKESDTEHNENMVTMFPELHFYILCKQFLGTCSRSVPGGFQPLHQ